MAVTKDAPSGPLDRPSDGITVTDIELQALQPASPTESEHTAAAQSGSHVRSAARDEPVLEEIVVHRSAETNAGDVNMVMSASASSKPTIFATERASQPEDADTSARGSDGREPPVSNNITHDLEGTSSSAAPPMEHEPSAPLPRSTAGARRQPTKPFFGLRKNAGNYGYTDDDYEAKYEPDPHGEEAGPNARVWRVYLDEAGAYDYEMVEEWKDTVDMLLVFAGLFSAVVTTFVAQTSQSLQPDYTQTSASLLTELVALQRAAAQGLPASDVPVSVLNTTVTFTSAVSDRVVNGFWFTSLALSLSTALFCILVKQWAQNYTSAISGPPKERALLRQMRFDGVGTWYVREIVGILPFFLHVSLLLFFAGLVVFLAALNTGISSVMAIVASLTYIAYAVSTIMPIMYLACPYRTPLSNHLRVLGALLRITGTCVYMFAIRSFQHAAYRCRIHATPQALSSSPLLTQYQQVFSTNNLKQRERNIVRQTQSEMLHFTANAIYWLLETTTKPSVTDIVYQSFSGFDQELTACIARDLPDRHPYGVVFHWLSALEHASALVSNPVEDESIVNSNILHLERISWALTKLASYSGHTSIWVARYLQVTARTAEKLSPVDQTIAFLNQYQYLLGSHRASALCHTLQAMYVGSFSDSTSYNSRCALVNSASSETYGVLLTGLEFTAQESAQLWAFMRYVVRILDGIDWNTPSQSVASEDHFLNRVRYDTAENNIVLRPFHGLDSHMKLLLVLGEQLNNQQLPLNTFQYQSRQPSILATSVVTALYLILYHQPLHSSWKDDLIMSIETEDMASRWVDRFCYTLLSIITGFTSQHPVWSSDKSTRDALTICILWVCDTISIGKSGYSSNVSSELLDQEHIDEYKLWNWEGPSVRLMWSKNVMPIVDAILSHVLDVTSSSFYDPITTERPISFKRLARATGEVQSIGFEYYKPMAPSNQGQDARVLDSANE